MLAFTREDPLLPLLLMTWIGATRQFHPVDQALVPRFPFQLLPFSATSFPSNHSAHLLLMERGARVHPISFLTKLTDEALEADPCDCR